MNLVGKLEVASYSDVGLKRNHNEDSIASSEELGLLVLADGMGGYKAGEVASAIAVNVIMEEMGKQDAAIPLGVTDPESGYSTGSLKLRRAVTLANHTIFTTAQNQPQCQGMGTTLVAVLFYDNRLTVAHVGDSRLYRLRGDVFEQITVDHSLLQELVDKGFYTPEEARLSVQKNLVTRAMGVDPTVKCDLHEDAALAGDIYLLCSDGLSDLVSDGEMHLTINKYSANLEEAAQQLVQLANNAGGKDNISVILARVLKPFPDKGRTNWYAKVLDWF